MESDKIIKLALFGSYTEHTHLNPLKEFFLYLQKTKMSFCIDPPYAKELQKLMPEWEQLFEKNTLQKEGNLEAYDFAYSFGGDGTFLNTARKVRNKLPLLGINFGRLGFLTTVKQVDIIQATEALRRDMYKVETRTALQLESDISLFGEESFGLNDLTIHKSQSNEMITIHTYINGEYLNAYWGDGLVVATPTGSTAYSLSCGGPVIFPQSGNFVITPVAPHSLTVRPVIIPDDAVISFEIQSRTGQAMVALDTRTQLVDDQIELAVRKADFGISIIHPDNSGNYLNTLRTRLMWGIDLRNQKASRGYNEPLNP